VLRNIAGKTSIKMLGTDEGLKAVKVNGDSYWLRSRKEKHLTVCIRSRTEIRLPKGLTCRHREFSQGLLTCSL